MSFTKECNKKGRVAEVGEGGGVAAPFWFAAFFGFFGFLCQRKHNRGVLLLNSTTVPYIYVESIGFFTYVFKQKVDFVDFLRIFSQLHDQL